MLKVNNNSLFTKIRMSTDRTNTSKGIIRTLPVLLFRNKNTNRTLGELLFRNKSKDISLLGHLS